jgi:hypothetical protein
MHGIHGMIGCCGCAPHYDIRIVFFYDRDRTPGHICDSAIFDVLLNGKTVGQTNLNNSSRPPRPGIPSGGSVYGGEFHAEDVDDHIEVRLRCAPASCHNSITTFMMIVKRRDGKYAVLDSAGVTDLWRYDLNTLDYIYKSASFYRDGEKVYVNKQL